MDLLLMGYRCRPQARIDRHHQYVVIFRIIKINDIAYDTLQNQTIKMVPTCPLNSSSHNLHMNIIILRAPFSPMAYGHFDILQYMVSIDKIGYICIRNSKMTHFWLKMRPTKSTVIKRHDLRGVVLFFLVHFWDEYLTSLIHSFRKCIALFCR